VGSIGRGASRRLTPACPAWPCPAAVGVNVESPFLRAALAVPWKLSTSQQPQQQTTAWDIKDKKWASQISPGGGFGAVSSDGYGVSYMVSGEREFFFHVSGFRSAAPKTDVARFRGHIGAALDEMKAILSLALAEEKAAAEATKSPKALSDGTGGAPAATAGRVAGAAGSSS
jgi:hypothetical protein